MSYFTRQSLTAILQPRLLAQTLDDDGDGAEDAGVYDLVAQAACDRVDAILGGAYPVPFADPVPAAVAESARILFGELIHERRGTESDKNPFAARADAIRTQLSDIAAGKASLSTALTATATPGIEASPLDFDPQEGL